MNFQDGGDGGEGGDGGDGGVCHSPVDHRGQDKPHLSFHIRIGFCLTSSYMSLSCFDRYLCLSFWAQILCGE